MRRVNALFAAMVFLVPQASKSCDDGDRLPPNMIVNGRTKIIKSMIGQVYLSKGTAESAKKKGLKCEWRVIKANGVGSRFSIATGPLSIKFLPREVNGTFISRYCRLWVLQFKEN